MTEPASAAMLRDPAWRQKVGFDSIMSTKELRQEKRRLAAEAAIDAARERHG